MTLIDWIQANSTVIMAIATVILVLVTGFYAWQTMSLSRLTKKQADASVKMAEEAEKSIGEAIRPMIHIRVTFGDSSGVTRNAKSKNNIDEMYAKFKNIGRGPALHPEINIRHPYFKREGPLGETVLEVDGEVTMSLRRSDSGARPEESFEVTAKYQNMYGKWFRSRLTQDEHGQHHIEYKELESKKHDS